MRLRRTRGSPGCGGIDLPAAVALFEKGLELGNDVHCTCTGLNGNGISSHTTAHPLSPGPPLNANEYGGAGSAASVSMAVACTLCSPSRAWSLPVRSATSETPTFSEA